MYYVIFKLYTHLSARKIPCSGRNCSTQLLLFWYSNQMLTFRTCLSALSPSPSPYIYIYTYFDTHTYVFKTKGVQYWPVGILAFLIFWWLQASSSAVALESGTPQSTVAGVVTCCWLELVHVDGRNLAKHLIIYIYIFIHVYIQYIYI